MIEEKEPEREKFVNDNINLCPECNEPMRFSINKYKCFKCGIEIEKQHVK